MLLQFKPIQIISKPAILRSILLGAFAKLWKSTITLHVSLSVCLSFLPSFRMEQLCYLLTDFREIWYFNVFRRTVEKIQVLLLKSDKKNG
jgi:hypothetical protein